MLTSDAENAYWIGLNSGQKLRGRHVVSAGSSANKAKKLRIPASIDTLSPQNRFVRTMNKLPIADHIPYHSIIGDRGRGDAPNSSDGIVPYRAHTSTELNPNELCHPVIPPIRTNKEWKK
jgi:hypothetical protein